MKLLMEIQCENDHEITSLCSEFLIIELKSSFHTNGTEKLVICSLDNYFLKILDSQMTKTCKFHMTHSA